MGQDTTAYNGPVIYLELIGGNFRYSINAEHVVKKFRQLNLSIRMGFTTRTFNISDNQTEKFRSIPVSIQIFSSPRSNHHLEAGIGLNYIQGTVGKPDHYNKTLVLNPSLGYRLQRPKAGIFLRILYIPLIKLHDFSEAQMPLERAGGRFDHSVGLSLGYSFRGND
jgi:hypothetical protein